MTRKIFIGMLAAIFALSTPAVVLAGGFDKDFEFKKFVDKKFDFKFEKKDHDKKFDFKFKKDFEKEKKFDHEFMLDDMFDHEDMMF